MSVSIDTAVAAVTKAVRESFVGNKLHTVWLVDQLLKIATQFETFDCEFESENTLRFSVSGQSVSLPVERARMRLRQVCARLSVLVNEQGTEEIISPYGGEGRLAFRAKSGESAHFQLRFENTPEKQEFHLTRIST